MTNITYTPIAVVRSPFREIRGMPIQTVAAQGIASTVEVDAAYAAGLKALEGFSHLWLVTHLDASQGYSLTVTPFMDDAPHGVFATRSPRRPNALGLSLVRLVRIEGTTLHIEDIDLLDGTPVLDIKPYVPRLDERDAPHTGWYEANVHKVHATRSDERFKGPASTPQE